YSKRALPDYGVFDEERYFSPGNEPLQIYKVRGVNIGITICEDIWIPNGISSELTTLGAQVILNLNASPYEKEKLQTREMVLKERVEETGIPIVYVNQVGAQDELVFDGGSFVMNSEKEIIARASQFKEEVLVFDLEVQNQASTKTNNLVQITSVSRTEAAVNTPPPLVLTEEEQIWNALCLGTRDYVKKNGFTDVCLGLSGGIDSAIVAAIACDAIGPEHVHAIMMPSRFSSTHSVSDAQALIQNLKCHQMNIPIEPAHKAFLDMTEDYFAGLSEGVAEENIQSRIRGTLLMTLSNKFGWLVLTTGNKSELAVGYSTLYGDTAGAFSVIKDLWKTEVFSLSNWKNKTAGYEVIPETIITKPPSAELRPDQRDDQTLPDYAILDELLKELVENDVVKHELLNMGYDPEVVHQISRLVDLAEYKRRQSPLGPKISKKSFGRDRRIPITNAYSGNHRQVDEI
ncbi:MAG: NAD+ synthase, partial [Actinomycetota bacterium]|nr:NAD+ synthase [Actinomycetota bacterium]